MSDMTLTKRMQEFLDETTDKITATPDRLMRASRGALNMTREEADHLLHRGEDLFDELVKRGEKIEAEQTGRFSNFLKDWQDRSRKQMHEAEAQIEQQVQNVLRSLHIPTADDVSMLNKEIEKISKKLEAYLKTAEEAALPIPGYGDLSAKQVVAMLDEVDEHGLQAIQKFEMAHDGRKTILRDIEHRLEALKA